VNQQAAQGRSFRELAALHFHSLSIMAPRITNLVAAGNTSRVLFAVLIATAVAVCSAEYGVEVSSTSDTVGVALREGRTVRLSEYTAFSWDAVRIFSPYTSRTAVCQQSGIDWPQCASVIPKYVDEGDFLLVFSAKGKYVAHEFHHRKNGDYCEQSCALVLTPAEATFRGQPSGVTASGQVHYVLRRAAVSNHPQ
jgi:hypothetical protein